MRIRPLLLLTTLFLAAACQARDAGESSSADMATEASAPATGSGADALSRASTQEPPPATTAPNTAGAAPAQPPTPGAEAPASTAPMIIRTGRAVVEVDSLERAVARVRALAERLGGYVSNTSILSGREEARQAILELKIPAARFEQALSGLTPLGRVESVNVEAQDVGEEFVDVTARVANARRMEERLVELLATRTGRLEDVLTVERELARVREEIERYDGRLRYLRTRAATSTLTVTVHEPQTVIDPGERPIADAFGQAWRNFIGFIAGFIALLGVLVPLSVLALVAWWIFRRMRRSGPPPRPSRPVAELRPHSSARKTTSGYDEEGPEIQP